MSINRNNEWVLAWEEAKLTLVEYKEMAIKHDGLNIQYWVTFGDDYAILDREYILTETVDDLWNLSEENLFHLTLFAKSAMIEMDDDVTKMMEKLNKYDEL